ncbi:MAG: YeeE/YedE thiosulfate transporter family protein [Vicinamibacteria bacterium]
MVAFLIGIGFGFFLERAGFGSARKLVSQFYLDDLSVFKVMFTAIVTAMLGVTYLAWTGVLDLSLVYLVPTYRVAQVVGGLLLGVGFVVGGYCPGTSIVSTATGKIDGLVFVLGFPAAAGTLAFAVSFPSGLHRGRGGDEDAAADHRLPHGPWSSRVVLMAIGGSGAGAAWVEGFMARRTAAAKAEQEANVARWLQTLTLNQKPAILALALGGGLAVFAKVTLARTTRVHEKELLTAAERKEDHVTPRELAA